MKMALKITMFIGLNNKGGEKVKDLKIFDKLIASDYLIIKGKDRILYDGLTCLAPASLFQELEIKKVISNTAGNLVLITRK